MKKKKILLTLGIAAMMGLAGCGETPTDPQTPVDPPVVVVDPVVTGITLKAEGDKTAMDIGTTLKFTATVTGEGDFNKQYTFSVDKEDIATISNEGVLTAKAEGSVVVTATAAGDTTKKSSITITVNEVAVCEIKDIVKNQRKHVVGKITALTTRGLVIDDGTGAVLVYLNAAPEGYAIGDVLSVAGKVAEYHNNLQFPKESIVKKTESTIETTTISTPTAVTAASYDEMAETIKVLTPISFTATAYELESGDKKYTAFKVDDGSTHIIEPTDLPDSFSVAIGTLYNVTGYVAPYYTSSSSGSSYASFYLTAIAPKPIPVTSITVTAAGGATSVGLNETLQMGVTIAPEKASNKAVTWSVDKSNIATIDENGVLTGVAPGTVVVTATAKDGSGVSGTKSIEVLQFKDPVVSLTLGTAPAETVLGDGDIDVTVTVAGESSTSNFNPAYSATSSDETVATVLATDTGIKIHPVAAGTVTITVKSTGTNADGEQLTKTIELEVLGEPKPVVLTLAQASSWRPEDPTASKDYSNKLVELTGMISFYDNNVFLQDAEGHTVQIFRAYDAGTYAYNTETKEFTLTPGSESKDITKTGTDITPVRNALLGKTATFKGILTWFVNNNGTTSIELKNCLYSGVSEEKVAATFEKVKTGEGSYDVSFTESSVYGESISITNVTPADGYTLGSITVDYGSHMSRVTSNTDTYTFTSKTYNKIVVNFVKPETFTTSMSVTQALARAAEDDMSRLFGRRAFSEYIKVTGVLASIDDANSYTIADPADPTKKISVYSCSALTDLKDANPGQLGIGYEVTVISQIQNFNGTIQLTNHVSATAVKGEITGYTVRKGTMANGGITSIKDANNNDVTEETIVAPGSVLTVTTQPSSGYVTSGLDATNCAAVEKTGDNTFKVTVYGDTVLTGLFMASSYTSVAAYSFNCTKGSASSDVGTIKGWFQKTSGESDIIESVSSPTQVAPGANGGSGTTAWERGNLLKIGASKSAGSLTINFAAPTTIKKVAITGFVWSGASVSLTTDSSEVVNDTVLSTKTQSKTVVESEDFVTGEFAFVTAASSITISASKTLCITAIEFFN